MLNINLQTRTIIGINIGLAILVCFTLIYTLWQWRQDWVLTHQTIKLPKLAAPNEAARLIRAIPDQHLFGKSFAKGDVPITSLQLQVTGIVKTSPGVTSKAYISIAGQPSKIYQKSDTLPYGVKIYDITADAVILENDGRLEKLPLPRRKLKFKPKYTGGDF